MNEANTSSKRCDVATSESREGIPVRAGVVIPRSEIEIRTTRSSGAGGQHVNKTASRVELTWNVRETRALSDVERSRILNRLESRLSIDGVLRVVASDTRSQFRNRELAETRLVELIRRSLAVAKPRKPTKPSPRQKQVRLDAKRHRSERKRERRQPPSDE